ncbi:MAG: LamG domain-containing protein [Armatimonadota bacterium]|nr:LamG domain-containing protein [Armatimonadota bacterium]
MRMVRGLGGQWRRRYMGAALPVVVFACALCPADTGTVTYPSAGNIEMREGTLEMWVSIPFDVQEYLPSDETYQGLLAIARIEGEHGTLSLGYCAGAMMRPGAGLFASLGSDLVQLHSLSAGQFTPLPGEWHHVAVTWSGNRVRYYVDGEMRGERVTLAPLAQAFGSVGAKPLLLGDPWGRNARMAIDELRVSSVERAPEELGWHGRLEVDPYTRILDRFDQTFEIDGETRTSPEVIFVGDGGLPSRHCRFIDGRFGGALALYLGGGQ